MIWINETIDNPNQGDVFVENGIMLVYHDNEWYPMHNISNEGIQYIRNLTDMVENFNEKEILIEIDDDEAYNERIGL
jgi:hypothetical protein